MAKDIRDGVEHVDDTPVSAYVGKFSGNFDVEPRVGQTWVRGDLHTFLVTARLGRRQTDSSKVEPGTAKLTDSLTVEEVLPIDRDKATFMLDSLGVKVIGVNELPEMTKAERKEHEATNPSEESLFSEDDFVAIEDDPEYAEGYSNLITPTMEVATELTNTPIAELLDLTGLLQGADS